ncbi:CobW family GTP-binding protein [Bacillus dakarensis]|uniref:CobW family GTP-binding protein n=1 Tax=Robertmurraya dakarensis TaxID=1926278 RepID=UPI000981536E|nr:GTP-binding protein [Bacillus dakarensis]
MIKTEIYILSGFLGSGKTTLLKQLIADELEQGRKVAVMMNELGEVSIDSNAVSEDVPLKELLDGCICCTIQDKLEAQLQGLLAKERPDVIYIESTGAAHPVEVLDAVLSPLFADQLSIKGIISILDGKRWLSRRELSPQIQQLLLEQIRHGDLIVINRSDELTEAEKGQVSLEIQNINQQGLALLTSYSRVSMKQIRGLSLGTKSDAAKSHVRIDLNLSTFVHKFKKPIKHSNFEEFLLNLPEGIYRMKGYIKFDHSQLPYLFQYSYGMPLYFKEEMNYPLNLVFIGENINWARIEEELIKLEEDQ